MTTATTSTFMQISAVPAERLNAIRASKRDDNGETFSTRVDDEGGAPLRCCLRDSRVGEHIALIGYRPFRQPGPYAEVGPIFIHADECPGYPMSGSYPDEFRGRPQVFRAYRADGAIAGGLLVKPEHSQEGVVQELFADPGVAFIHSRNVIYGCYMFEITRSVVSRPPPAEPSA